MAGAVVKKTGGGFAVRVRLTPNAAKDAVDGVARDAAGTPHIAARVRAVPEKGKANAALEALLAKTLGVPKTAVTVARGSTGRVKTVHVTADGDAFARAAALWRDRE